jgi:type 1 fimbria pilin
MANFNFQKSALAISSAAALTLLSVATQAQSASDFGELLIEGQISNTTCVLSLGDPQSTGAGKKTVNLGTYKAADYTSTAIGTDIGTAKTTVLSVKNADGTQRTAGAGNSLWDVGVNVNASNYDTVGGVTVLKSTATSGIAATGVGVKLMTSVGTAPTVGSNAVDFASGNATYGTLLSGNTASAPAVPFANSIAVTAQMVKTVAATVAPGAGVFTHSIPLNVWYK